MSEAPNTAPALGFSITAAVGEHRQVVFQSFVPLDAKPAEINAALDKVADAVDRQQARAQLPELRAELEKHQVTLRQFREDRERLEAQFLRDSAMIDLGVKTQQGEIAKTLAAGEKVYREQGRQGVYAPSGHVKASIERIQSQIDAADAQKANTAAERDLALQNLGISEQRYVQEIERIQAKVTEAETKLKDG